MILIPLQTTLQIVSFANFDVTDTDELIPEESNCKRRKPADFDPARGDASRYQGDGDIGLDLQNCNLTCIRNVSALAAAALFHPDRLIYLDLRCNKLASLEGVEALQSLKILYAHGNRLESVRDLLILQKLPHLEALTVHGNPLVRQVNYKYWIILRFPRLRRLDFSGITRVDRMNAEQARAMNQITLRVDPRVVVE